MNRAVPAVAAAVVVLATACGGTGQVAGQTDPSGGAGGTGGAGAAGSLSFESMTVDGEPFDASALAGDDVVLWFWAPWCSVCRVEAPQVLAASQQVDGVEVVGVASAGPVADMAAFVESTGTGGLTHVADVTGEVWEQFGIVAQPTFVFVDDDGRTQTFAGGLTQAALVDAMRQLEEA